MVISRRHVFDSPPEPLAEQLKNVSPLTLAQAQTLIGIVEADAGVAALK